MRLWGWEGVGRKLMCLLELGEAHRVLIVVASEPLPVLCWIGYCCGDSPDPTRSGPYHE